MANRTHMYFECRSEECPTHKDKSLGNYYGDPRHDIYTLEGRYYSKCLVCENIEPFRDPDFKQKLKYPSLNASTGEYFKSRDEEKSYAKKHKLEAVS